ncbi:sulfotransferase [Flavobacteriaceae bacterium SZ-1-7]|uniref:sulfotransferase family protein n=1 Tax=Tamlana sedimenti TaxID=3134126 RepID=UPI00312795F4
MGKPNINLFIVGAAKSGTTSLYNYLKSHSDVFFPLVKEPNYYSDIESEDKLVYNNPKPKKFYHNKIINDRDVYYSLYKDSKNYSVVGDASPSYLWDKNSAKRIYDDFPNAKIIIILRNPINRAFSHYLMNIKSGVEKEDDFLKALIRDENTFPKVWGDGKVMLYKELGMYFSQVKSYYNVFKKENIKVIIYEEFFKDTQKGINSVLEFLRLPNFKPGELDLDKKHNVYRSPKGKISKLLLRKKEKFDFARNVTPRWLKKFIQNAFLFKNSSKPEISKEAFDYLSSAFEREVLGLEKLLDKKLDAWK